jgi:glycosyltransferase involved in cell wall biosynthesis
MKKKIIRATTVSQSLSFFEGTMPELIKDYDVQLLSSPGEQLDFMGKKYGVKTHAIEMYRRLSPLKDLKSLRQLVKFFHNEKPYMVHSMTPKAGLLCMMAAWLTKVPVRVHTFTGLVWPTEHGWKRKLLIFTDKITCACASHVIPEGEGVKNDLLNNHITKKPIRVLGFGNVMGVDMVRFSRRPEVDERAKLIAVATAFTFVFVGRIVKDKGINELCTAFNRLNKQHPNTRLFLVGNFEDNVDPISDESRNMINDMPAIQAVGSKYGDDLLAYYAASDCFVFPSYREGFPNTVLEAGAMDLPCIVTDINGSREIIVEGENGTIVPPRNEEDLFKAMGKMMTDDDWRGKMKHNARQMIIDRFEQGFVQKCLLDYYNELLKGVHPVR